MSGTAAILASNRAAPTPAVVSNFAKNRFDWETLLTTTAMPTGGSISRAGNAMHYDSTGRLTWGPNNLCLWSNDQTNSFWIAIANATTQTATSVTFSGASSFRYGSVSAVTGAKYIISAVLSCDTGGKIGLRDGQSGTFTSVTLTSTPTRYHVVVTATGGIVYPGLDNQVASGGDGIAKTVTVSGYTVSRVTYETTPRAADQVITTTAAYFGPRFDTDPLTLQPKGLLLEGARTNLVTYSEDFSNAAWSIVRGAVTANSTTAPDGTNNADLILCNTTSASGMIANRASVYTISSGATITYSVYVKVASGSFMYVIVQDGTNGVRQWFDVSSVSTGSTSSFGSGWSKVAATIVNVGNGWRRCTFTVSTTGTTTAYVNMYLGAVADGDLSVTTGVSGAYVWGAQLEAGAWASSYLPTVATTTSRAAETFTLTGYANRLIEAYWIEQETGVASSIPETVISSGAVTINPPQFGWVTSLRAYTNAYAGDIATPSWIDNSGTNGNRMVTDSTGTLTWAPSNLFSNSASPSQTNTISAGIEGGGDYIVSYYGGGTLVLKQTNSAGAVITPSSTGTVSSRNYAKFTVPNGVSAVYIDFGAAATNAQLERVTYQTQPRALIETSGSAKFLPRYDFDAATTPATPLGMRIEEARSNLMPYSNSTGSLSIFGSNGANNAATSPDGTTSAFSIVPTSVSGQKYFYRPITVAAAAHTFSMYAKAFGYNVVRVADLNSGDGATFNLTTGVASSVTAGYTASSVYVGNGWWRLSVTFTPAAGSYLAGAYINQTTAFSGDGVSGVLFFGLQLEAGAFATSLIPTTTGSVQRVADVVKLSGTALTTAYGSQGSMVAEFTFPLASATNNRVIGTSAGMTDACPIAISSAGNGILAFNGSQLLFSGGVVVAGTPARGAFAWSASGRSIAANNTAAVSDANGVGWSSSDAIYLGRGAATNYLNGRVRSLALYNTRLPDAALKAKSTLGASF